MNHPIDISDTQIQTPRLTLRPWRERDLEDLYTYAKEDGVGQLAGWLPHKDREESRAILSSFMEGKKVFALEYRGKVIGSLGVESYREDLYPQLSALRGREIGYVLSKDYWGQGLMPEAVQAVIAWLFGTVGLDFILVGHFDRNLRSRRVIEKCGFQFLKKTVFQTHYDTQEICSDYILYHPERREQIC